MNPFTEVAAAAVQAVIPALVLKPQNSSVRGDSGKTDTAEPDFAKVMAKAVDKKPIATKPDELTEEEKSKMNANASAGDSIVAGLVPFVTALITTEPIVAAAVSVVNALAADAVKSEPAQTISTKIEVGTLPISAMTTATTLTSIQATPVLTEISPADEVKPDILQTAVTLTDVKLDKATVKPDVTSPNLLAPEIKSADVPVSNVEIAEMVIPKTDVVMPPIVRPASEAPVPVASNNAIPTANPVTNATAAPVTPIVSADVVSVKLSAETKPVENLPADTAQLEVAPGIERLRIQPSEAGLPNKGEQGFGEKNELFQTVNPAPELSTEDAPPTFVLPVTDPTPNGYRAESVANTAPPPPTPQDPHSVFRQVLDAMPTSLDRMKSSEITITLKPENLGEVTVKISVDGNRVAAAFHSANPEVRGILESSLPQLRQEMSQQGWNFEHGGVFGEMQGFLNQQQQSNRNQPELPIVKRDRAGYDSVEPVSMSVVGNGSATNLSIDYRV